MKKLYLIAALANLANHAQGARFWPFSKSPNKSKFDSEQKSQKSYLKAHKLSIRAAKYYRKANLHDQANRIQAEAMEPLYNAIEAARRQRNEALFLAERALARAEENPTKDNVKKAHRKIARGIKWEDKLLKPHRDELERFSKKIAKRTNPIEQTAKRAELAPFLRAHKALRQGHEGTLNILEGFKARVQAPRAPTRRVRIHDATPASDEAPVAARVTRVEESAQRLGRIASSESLD